MADYNGIKNVSNILVKRLQERLVPDLVQTESMIALRSPDERKDVNVGIYLYDVRPTEHIATPQKIMTGLGTRSLPPLHLDLYYMITVYMDTDIKFREEDSQRVMGSVVQTLYQDRIIDYRLLGETGEDGRNLLIEMVKIPAEEKTRLWNFPSLPMRVSLFYKVSPLAISADISEEFARVKTLDIRYKDRMR